VYFDRQISTLYVSDLNNNQQMWAVVEKVIEKHGQLHALVITSFYSIVAFFDILISSYVIEEKNSSL